MIDSDPTTKLPARRPLDVVAFKTANHDLCFALRDLTGISEKPVAISFAGYFVLAHLDGSHSCADIQAAFARELGREIDSGEILRVVQDFDGLLLLQTPRFEQAHAERRDAYAAADTRDNRARAPDAQTLRAEVETRVLRPTASPRDAHASLIGGPSANDRPARAAPLAIIAPHLDYARGEPAYAAAYAALAGTAPAARFVILGTNHFGCGRSGVVATGKDFVTPLGRTPTDRRFLEAVESRLDRSLRGDEYDHAAEHSIELHVQILQASRPPESFEIVPVLCPDPSADEAAATRLAEFAEALRHELEATPVPTLLIASADLSHVGQRFGEPAPTDAAFMAEIGRRDGELLTLLAEHREDEFVRTVRGSANPTRICSIGCIYAALHALPAGECRVIRYHQAVDYANETHVTCAAAVIEAGDATPGR